jgi:hypothetical protein
LAAAIKSAFDLKAELVEGHDGIYEVSIEGQVIYTNSSSCSQGFPDHGEIIERVSKATGLTPAESCQERQNTDSGDCGCGCSPPTVQATDTQCCDSSASCCSPTDTEGKSGSLGRNIVAGVILLAAIGLAGFSVAKKSGWISDGQGTTSVAAAEAAGSGFTPSPLSTTLTELRGDHDAVFALLPCGHEDHTQELRDMVAPAIVKLKAKGKRTDLVIVDPSSPAYTELANLYNITAFPCIAIVGTGCAPSPLSGDVTEERVFSAFIAATSSSCAESCGSSSCGTAKSGSSCCP